MTTDLRHLLAIYVHAHQTGNSVPPHIDAEARAALADVPDGREPASVVQEPSDAELVGKLVEAANGAAAMGWDKHAQSILRAAELLQRQTLPEVGE